eukprot:1055099-Prorocentrum_minimum.AAC.1
MSKSLAEASDSSSGDICCTRDWNLSGILLSTVACKCSSSAPVYLPTYDLSAWGGEFTGGEVNSQVGRCSSGLIDRMEWMHLGAYIQYSLTAICRNNTSLTPRAAFWRGLEGLRTGFGGV